MNKQTKALKDLLEAVEHAIEIGDWQVDGRCDPDLAINRAKKALEQEQSFAEKTAQISFMSLWDAYTTLKMKLESLEQPQCNPHPKAPHGFNRDASHSADRYVCDCEGWDAWEDGYDEGLRRGLEL